MNQEELYDLIAKQQPNICQIVAYKDGEKVYSDCWNDYKTDDCTHIMSATKSIMALLIGIALDKGQIGSIDDKVLDYFPDYKVKKGEKTIHDVTIQHLLTMRAPYKCKGDPWTKVCSSDNWTQSPLDFLGGRKGMTDEFNYQTVCLHILSGILYQATHIKTVDYANENLFEPLGIQRDIYADVVSTIAHGDHGHTQQANRFGFRFFIIPIEPCLDAQSNGYQTQDSHIAQRQILQTDGSQHTDHRKNADAKKMACD